MNTWKKIFAVMENWMSAVAYSDANLPEEAVRVSGQEPKWDKMPSFDSITTAITFAEAGEHGMAREYLGQDNEEGREGILDIPGIKVWVGTVRMEAEPLSIPGVKIWTGRVPVNGA